MELEKLTYLTSGSTTKPQSSRHLSSAELPGASQTLPGTSSSQRVTGLELGISYLFSLTPVRDGVRGPKASITQSPGRVGTAGGAHQNSWMGRAPQKLSPLSCSVSPWPDGCGVPGAHHSRQCSSLGGCEASPGAPGVCTRASRATGGPGLAPEAARFRPVSAHPWP